MAAAAEELDRVKSYMRVDTDEDDSQITGLIGAAKAYLKNAGVEEPEEENPLYNLAVDRLTLFYYDQRSDTETKGESRLTPGLNAMILQLRYSAGSEEAG